MIRIAAVVLLLFAVSSPADAQTVRLTTGLAVAGHWDDETHLGNGVLMAAGVSMLPHDKVRVEAELAIGRHNRDSGYLQATGTPITGIVRAALRPGGSQWRARPFLSVGGMILHSRGEFSSVGQVQPWRVTEPGMEFGAGVEIRGGNRMWWRPEVRLSGTRGQDNFTPGRSALELPVMSIRTGLTVIW